MKSPYIKVKDHEHLVKDVRTGAILNVDQTFVTKHEQRMASIKKEERREQEINTMKSDIAEIKALLQKLISG
jgi:hypothetical protein